MQESSQKGQMLLIVVLTMVVALSVALALASRSITNLRISTEEQNSQKALFAAEAGVEIAVKTGSGSSVLKPLGSAHITTVSLTDIQGIQDFLLYNGARVPQDDGADIWLTNYTQNYSRLYAPPYWNGQLTFYWGTASDICSPSASTNTMAALEVFIITGTRGNPTMYKYAFDPCSQRANINKFLPAQTGAYQLNTTDGVKKFAFKSSQITVTNGLVARVIPVYAGTAIWVHGSNNFPSQGKIITSVGSAGTTTRKIVYFQGYESIPSEFFYSLFVPK